MKKLLGLLLILGSAYAASAQVRYVSRNATIGFTSETPVEKIEAFNRKAATVLDATTGKVELSALMTAFSFEKALMEEHFNENYVESHKFPKATFKGQILDISKIDFNKDGTYIVKIKGMLNVHGVDKEVVTDAKVVVTGKNLKVTASFTVTPSDFKVEIPSLVKDKIAKEIKVTVDAPYTKM